ncbi:MAG: hypothetical protein QXU13_02130 [Desulfurococcaceae archaeon]
MMNAIQCVVLDHVICEDTDWRFENSVFYLDTREKRAILFIHGINSSVICNGSFFQVFVWGTYKYTLWHSWQENTMCVVKENINFSHCHDGFIGIVENNEKNASETLCELDKYGKLLAKLLSRDKYVVFIVKRHGVLNKLPNVIVNDESENRKRLMEYLRQKQMPQLINCLEESVDLLDFCFRDVYY